MPKEVRADYQSKMHKPTDFEAFWQDVLRQVEAIPLAPEMVPEPLRTSDDIEVFQVFYQSLDQVRIAAWYCRPNRRAERSPAILFLPGYQMDPPIPKEWARKGYIALSVAPRGKLRSLRQFNPGYPNLLTHNIVDRHTYAYRGFYVDTWRSIDFLLSRPEVDPTRIGVTGTSQGGGLTICTAAMRPEIRAAATWMPSNSRILTRMRRSTTICASIRTVVRRSRRPSPTSMALTSRTTSPARSSSISDSRTTSARRKPAMRCSTG